MAEQINVAIVDYGLGNLFSVQRACEHVGMQASITTSPQAIQAADAVILPGVGAFGDAMQALRSLDLVKLLREIAAGDQILVGICLGLQLMMSESYEFGCHEGLGLFEGPVVRFEQPRGPAGELKVPQVGWNRILRPDLDGDDLGVGPHTWEGSPLAGLRDGSYMYFVHSFHARPTDSAVVLATSHYGDIEFCSALRKRNVFAFQFHPERSGEQGIQIYRRLATIILEHKRRKELTHA